MEDRPHIRDVSHHDEVEPQILKDRRTEPRPDPKCENCLGLGYVRLVTGYDTTELDRKGRPKPILQNMPCGCVRKPSQKWKPEENKRITSRLKNVAQRSMRKRK